MANYIDIEKPLEELDQQIAAALKLGEESGADVSKTVKDLEKKREQAIKDIFKDLTPWERVQLSRHPDRPYTLEYIEKITEGDFVELHGDRGVKDDKAMVGALGKINGQSFMFIGQQKGINTKMRQYRNFGMPNPEGYRKANRLMKMADKFNIPIVTFIDTPGAFPGLEAEERGQGEAIAKNLYDMMELKVPVICIVIGEGASGGALGIGIGDRVLMMENTWYSVISPESCSSILWRSWDYKEIAASALKLTADDMKKNGLIDGIIKEPFGGAHANHNEAIQLVKERILKEVTGLQKLDADKRIEERIEKFCKMGVVNE